MHIGHARMCVCVSVSVSRRMPTLLHGPGCHLGMVGCPLVVHCWADLQSVHEFRCYHNIAPNAKCQRVLALVLCLVVVVAVMAAKRYATADGRDCHFGPFL